MNNTEFERLVAKTVKAVGTPRTVRARAVSLVEMNPNADPEELAAVIRADIDAALSK